MPHRRTFFAISLLAPLLIGCLSPAFDDALIATQESTAEPGVTPTSNHTAMPTGTFIHAVRPTLSASPTPILAQQSVSADGTCVPLSDNQPDITLGDRQDIRLLMDYLNGGGSPDALLDLPSENSPDTDLHQVVIQDLTADGIPDLLLAKTWIGGFDHSYLWAILCFDGKYQAITLLANFNGRIESIGLYLGGGFRVVSVQDFNQNGVPDILASMNQSSDNFVGMQYRLVEWDGSAFQSLISYTTNLGSTDIIGATSMNNLQIMDREEDGIKELVVDGTIFAWNGDVYTLVYTPPTATPTATPTLSRPGSFSRGLLIQRNQGLWVFDSQEMLQPIATGVNFRYDASFVLAPDKSALLYEYQGDIWRLDIASGQAKNLTQSYGGVQVAPQWWPGRADGFLYLENSYSEFSPIGSLIWHPFDGEAHVLAEDEMHPHHFAPCPDGETIVWFIPSFDGHPPSTHGLWLSRLGGTPERLDLAEYGLETLDSIRDLSWSPDGRRLGIAGTRPDDSLEIVVQFIDFEEQTGRLLGAFPKTGSGLIARHAPRWSPDGRRLVFYLSGLVKIEDSGLWVAEADGSGLHHIDTSTLNTHEPGLVWGNGSPHISPMFSPDGEWVVTANGHGNIVAVQTGTWHPQLVQTRGVILLGWIPLP